ncbi:hypothetical protein LTR10_023376 [Elasticomyces elasticus]|uniref:Major facilitator superfamily (MFS) profile domain-containing protein n=1 Tax=Exophiala sideris TaxID=1016849 RepID=A0ABR0IUH6_9EURO|nr:hypothetical protein LTR10_023376 [Elasticomyces elasticus]KAK5023141.1 hypothetical protein LTR13_011285 [Exophiala sideris]KAK5023363.1 hypothetical protein LTS07_009238 [Exophiala sideris]KAK5048725.1 hypothetical protein LTR69_011316 [Exophiala sideris]KAK5176127.1 hypothetical protein LTR44_011306 [Eurotiomycetes sp. CCFEE 6388]
MADTVKAPGPLPATAHFEDPACNNPPPTSMGDDPVRAERPSLSTLLSVFFLGLSFVPAYACGFLMMAGVLAQIGTDLGDVSLITWLLGAWSIAGSVSFGLAGSLSDVFGRRYMMLAGLVFMLIGSIVASTAKKMTDMIAAEALIGFGTGFISIAYAGIQELLPNKYRGIGVAWTEVPINIPWGCGAVLIALELTEHATWRWIYYISIIYTVVSLAGTAAFYFPPSHPQGDYDKSRWQELKTLDYIGIFLYTTGTTVFLVGLTWAGTEAHPWRSASTIAPIVLGGLTFAGSLLYDCTLARNPFFPKELMTNFKNYGVFVVSASITNMVFTTVAGLGPQVSLYCFTHDPVEIGLMALPYGCCLFITASVIPALLHKIGYLKYQLVGLLSMQTVFVALYAVAIPSHKVAWMVFLCFGQTPFSAISQLSVVGAGLHVRQEQFGVALGLIGTFRLCAGSVGNAIFNTILQNALGSQLVPRITKAALQNGFSADDLEQLIPAVIEDGSGVPLVLQGVRGLTPQVAAATRLAFREAYAYSFRRVFYATIPFGVLGIALLCLMNDPSKYLTNRTAVHLEKEVVGRSMHDHEYKLKVSAGEHESGSVELS